MTGLELLKEEMAKRGLSKTQCESKVVAVVLDIISKSEDNAYLHEYDARKMAEEAERVYQRTEQDKHAMEAEIESLKRTSVNLRKEIIARYECAKKYIEEFNESIMNCESEEGKDRMRAAQMFVNSIEVGSKYDNTAFIIGLAGILSGGKVSPMGELKKINPKLFEAPELGYRSTYL